MLNRRNFLVGTCCALHSGIVLANQANSTPQLTFKCSTVNTVKPGDPEDVLQLKPYGDTRDEIEFEKNQSDLGLTQYGSAYVKDRWHLSDGLTPNSGRITLGVYFINGSDADQQLIRSAAKGWTDGPLGQIFTLDYSVPQEQSHIRVAFDSGDGNWSGVGRQNNFVPKKQKTMNIESLEEFVVQHEFGHAWCLQHEHQFPGALHWNQDIVIADMQAEQQWPPSTTKVQILNPLKQSGVCIGDPQFNQDSIMLYPIKSTWNKEGFSHDWNRKISEGDIRCLAGLYGFKV
jgi:serralysin